MPTDSYNNPRTEPVFICFAGFNKQPQLFTIELNIWETASQARVHQIEEKLRKPAGIWQQNEYHIKKA